MTLPELLAREGKFALIAGEDLLGVFDTRSDALAVGYVGARLNGGSRIKMEADDEDNLAFFLYSF